MKLNFSQINEGKLNTEVWFEIFYTDRNQDYDSCVKIKLTITRIEKEYYISQKNGITDKRWRLATSIMNIHETPVIWTYM
jgi:hypothetical protein